MSSTNKTTLQPGVIAGIIVGIILALLIAGGIAMYLANVNDPVQSRAENVAARTVLPDISKTIDPNETLYGKPVILPKEEVPLVDNTDTDKNKDKHIKNTTTKKTTQDEAVVDGISAIMALKDPNSLIKPDVKSSEVKIFSDFKEKHTNNNKDNKDNKDNKTIADKSTLSQDMPQKTITIIAPKVVNIPMDDDIGKIASVVTPPKPVSTVDLPVQNERYYVQVGAYQQINEAETIKNRIESQGVAMSISTREKDGQSLHRVRTTPLSSVEAQRLRNKLKADGIESALVKVQ